MNVWRQDGTAYDPRVLAGGLRKTRRAVLLAETVEGHGD